MSSNDPLDTTSLKEQLQREKEKNAALQQDFKKLQSHLEKYELAASGSSEGLWDWDLGNNNHFISAPWLGMVGYKSSEVEMDRLWESLLHPDDKETAIQAFNDFIQGKSDIYEEDFRLRHKEGHYIWVRSKASLQKDRSGNPIRVSGSHKDITDRKIASEELRKSEKKYKYLFENSLVGMFRASTDTGELIEVNQKTWQILGLFSPRRYVFMEDFISDRDALKNLMEIIFERGNLEEQELKIQRFDGSETWIAISGHLFREADEEYLDFVIRDVSDFKENLVELQRLNFELDNFVYHASHDIRSPLRSVMGLIDILKHEKSPSAQRKVLEMITGSINRLDKFVVDLLAMSRDNRVQEPASAINFMVEINNSVTNFYHVYSTKDLEFRVKVIQNYPYYSDLTKIRIILNNLVSNAIKYRKHSDELSFINITVNTDPKEARLVIEDNGEGIPKDKLEKIFDMFYRASENSEGSGLGMYIVKNVIRKLEATIDVESEEGQGTKFTIVIPNNYKEEELIDQ